MNCNKTHGAIQKQIMTKSIIFILVILSQSAFAQKTDLRQALHSIISEMADDNMYKSASIGYGAAKTKQWARFVELKKIATADDLISLTNEESPAVRCYAFQALVEMQNVKAFDILLEHLADNEEIQSFEGMVVKKQKTGDFFLKLYPLRGDEQSLVDSVLLFNPDVRLAAKSDLLQKIKPKTAYYSRIKEIATNEDTPSALIAIAKFQKKKDIPLIVDRLQGKANDQFYALRAVRYFPDNAFFPYLKKIQQSQIKEQVQPNHNLIRVLYLAVVQYKDQRSRELIEKSLQSTKGQTKKNHAKFIWLALSKYPNAAYSGLKKEIKLSNFDKKTMQHWLNEGD